MNVKNTRPLILIVDDEPINLRSIGDILAGDGYSLSYANSGRAALDAARSALPTLILLDIGLPDINGLDVCRRLKDISSTSEIPVIFVTSHEHELNNAFEAGGVDYIRKPVHEAELRHRVAVHIRLTQLIDQLAYSNHRLTEVNYELARLSTTDPLTGIANRRQFDDVLEAEWRRCMREEQSLSLMMVDVDHFKTFNDEFGHQAGDIALKAVASGLKTALQRGGDLAARYGGEEFAIIMPNTSLDAAQIQAERIRAAVAALDIRSELPDARNLTVSIGLASALPKRDADAESLISNADQALYQAKLLGRNRVAVAAS